MVLPAPFGPSRPNTSPRCDGEVDAVDGRVIAEAMTDAAGRRRLRRARSGGCAVMRRLDRLGELRGELRECRQRAVEGCTVRGESFVESGVDRVEPAGRATLRPSAGRLGARSRRAIRRSLGSTSRTTTPSASSCPTSVLTVFGASRSSAAASRDRATGPPAEQPHELGLRSRQRGKARPDAGAARGSRGGGPRRRRAARRQSRPSLSVYLCNRDNGLATFSDLAAHA